MSFESRRRVEEVEAELYGCWERVGVFHGECEELEKALDMVRATAACPSLVRAYTTCMEGGGGSEGCEDEAHVVAGCAMGAEMEVSGQRVRLPESAATRIRDCDARYPLGPNTPHGVGDGDDDNGDDDEMVRREARLVCLGSIGCVRETRAFRACRVATLNGYLDRDGSFCADPLSSLLSCVSPFLEQYAFRSQVASTTTTTTTTTATTTTTTTTTPRE